MCLAQIYQNPFSIYQNAVLIEFWIYKKSLNLKKSDMSIFYDTEYDKKITYLPSENKVSDSLYADLLLF